MKNKLIGIALLLPLVIFIYCMYQDSPQLALLFMQGLMGIAIGIAAFFGVMYLTGGFDE